MGLDSRRGSKRSFKRLAVLAAAMPLMQAHLATACEYHWALGLPEPQGLWPNATDSTPLTAQQALAALKDADLANDSAVASLSTSSAATPDTVTPPIDAYVTSWLNNTTGVKGKSTDATINAAVSQISANIQLERYTATNVYVKCTGIPDYNVGPFNGNPNVPANSNATFDILRNPQPAVTHTATGLGAIGVLVNGVEVFNMSDSFSYQNQGVWHNNAGVVEAPSFDAAKAHPQQQGVYHNHELPVSLISELGGSSSNPVVLGFANDGYPILNGYASLTANGAVLKADSGYQKRTYTNNIRGNGGPNVGGQYVLGYFEEDFQWVSTTEAAGEFELDQYNGAFVYTPQFPTGTYAYFATFDSTGAAAYPYLVGPQYYGTPQTDDLPGGTVVVPADSVVYTPEPASAAAIGIALSTLMMRRQRNRLPA